MLSNTGKFSSYNAAPGAVRHNVSAVEAPATPVNVAPAPVVVTAAAEVSPVAPAPAAAAVDLEQAVLSHMAAHGLIHDTWIFAAALAVDHQVLIGVIKSLMVDKYVLDEPLTTSFWTLTEEGRAVSAQGSPEIQVFEAVPATETGIAVLALNTLLGDVAKIGVDVCMKNKWLQKKGDQLVRTVQSVQDETRAVLQQIEGDASSTVSEDELKDLKKRKLVQQITRKSFRITKGPDFCEKRVKKMADLHKSILDNKVEPITKLFDWSKCLRYWTPPVKKTTCSTKLTCFCSNVHSSSLSKKDLDFISKLHQCYVRVHESDVPIEVEVEVRHFLKLFGIFLNSFLQYSCPSMVSVDVLDLCLSAWFTIVRDVDSLKHYDLYPLLYHCHHVVVQECCQLLLVRQKKYWCALDTVDTNVQEQSQDKIKRCADLLHSSVRLWREREYSIWQLATSSAEKLLKYHPTLQQEFINEILPEYLREQGRDTETSSVLYDLQRILDKGFRTRYKCVLTPFGSRVSGLATRDSDLDIAISLYGPSQSTSQSDQRLLAVLKQKRAAAKKLLTPESTKYLKLHGIDTVKTLRIITEYVRSSRLFRIVDTIWFARIPIIKLQHIESGLDVSFRV
jgi:predicted nucleotidyltransferase